jgi:hypothetical protein
MFPKYSFYTDKPSVKQLSMRKIIDDAIREYVIVTPKVFIEDEFAFSYLNNKEPISCTNKRDVSIIEKVALYGDYTVTLSMMYDKVPNVSVELEAFKSVPLSVIKEKGVDKFYEKSAELCKERSKTSAQYQASKERVIIAFIGNKTSKNYLLPEPAENDGLLYVKVNLETGNIDCTYSGMWIDKENARKVIGAIYGG